MSATQLQRLAIIAACVVIVVAAFLLGLLLTGPGTSPLPEQVTPAPSVASTAPVREIAAEAPPSPDAVENMLANLWASQAALQQCADFMDKATINNKGGYVEKARADLEQARLNMIAAIDYVRAHPELARERRPPELPEFPVEPPPPAAGPPGVPNLRKAMTALTEAHRQLNSARGGALGGHRDKLNADFKRAANNIIAGIHFNVDGSVPPALK